MDDPLADGALGGRTAGGESNVNALLARGAEADSGCAGAEKLLACRSKENGPKVRAAVEGVGAIGSSPVFSAAPIRFT